MTNGQGGGFVRERITSSRSTTIVFGGAMLALVGSFLSWASVSAGPFSQSIGGMDGDGVITLIFAIAMAAFAVYLKGLGRMVGVVVAAALLIVVAVVDIIDVNRLAGDIDFGEIDVSVGIGLWLVLIGGIAAAVGVLFVKE